MSVIAALTSLLVGSQPCLFPPSPHPVVASFAHGESKELRVRGAPGALWYEDDEGHAILRHGNDWVFATLNEKGELQPTNQKLGGGSPSAGTARHLHSAQIAPDFLRRADRHGAVLHPHLEGPSKDLGHQHQRTASPLATSGSLARSALGTVKNLVIAARFSDHGPAGQNRTLPSDSDLDVILNAVGGDPVLAPTGSVRDAYIEYSLNGLILDSTVIAWVNLPNTEAYYANGNSGLTSLTWDLIQDALNAADPLVNFGDFDSDGDGAIDAITFLHSGYGAEWGGLDQYGTDVVDRIWSHRWSIPTWTSAEGVTVSDYSISPGLWDVSGSDPGRIGVICHELGHFFGLPDLYDTDGSSQAIGNWDLMAAGGWGFDGSQQYPSHPSAWCKQHLGWIETQVMTDTSPGTLTMEPTGPTGDVRKIESGYPPGEYLLLEYRRPVGFDALIPEEGLLVWHIDETQGFVGFNNVNQLEGFPAQAGWPTNGNHYRVALLAQDGLFDGEQNVNRGDGGDVYTVGSNPLNGGTTPSSDRYQEGVVGTTDNQFSNVVPTVSQLDVDYQNPSAPQIGPGTLPSPVVGVPYSLSLSATGGVGGLEWSEYKSRPGYAEANLGSSWYSGVGVAQGWNADDGIWPLALPFSFPFYTSSYSTVYVSSNGFLDFAPVDSHYGNDASLLRYGLRIAPLWDDLDTSVPSGDIWVDTSIPGEVTIRWSGEVLGGPSPIQFSVQLFETGVIRFHYGGANNGLTPTVGLGGGENGRFLLAEHDGATSLNHARSLEFRPLGSEIPPGMTLSDSGVLSGIPAATGTFHLQAEVTDSDSRHDIQRFSFDVASSSPTMLTFTAYPQLVQAGDMLTLYNEGAAPVAGQVWGRSAHFITEVSGVPIPWFFLVGGTFDGNGKLSTSLTVPVYDPSVSGESITIASLARHPTNGLQMSTDVVTFR